MQGPGHHTSEAAKEMESSYKTLCPRDGTMATLTGSGLPASAFWVAFRSRLQKMAQVVSFINGGVLVTNTN